MMRRVLQLGLAVVLLAWGAGVCVAQTDASSDDLIRKTLTRGGSSRVRLILIEEIEKKQQAAFLDDLEELLSDADREVREASARAIASFGWERMSGVMFRVLSRRTASVEARSLAARTLAKTGRREAVAPLLDVLDEPAMGPVAMDALREVTSRDFKTPEAWRRWWSVNRHRMPGQWASDETEELRRRVRELETELAAARKRALELEERAADAVILSLENRADRQAPTPLITALDEPFVKVRKFAAAELGKLKAVEALKKLSDLAETDGSAEVRVACASALGQINSPDSVVVLGRLLGDSNEQVAAAAARALGRLKDNTVVNRLLVALLNRSPVVRASAAEALGQIGNPAAVTPLVELLGSDPEPSVREAAARALGEIGDDRALARLEAALDDERPAVRAYAIEALGTLKAVRVVPRLCTLLEKDENPSVREAAVVTLGKIGGAESLPALVAVVSHGSEKLVQLAASSIVAVCRRNEPLLEPTADQLVTTGHPEQAVKLYELLTEKLAAAKDDKRLISVQVKLADGFLASAQWTKAAPLLEELTRTLPDDVGLAEKRALALTRLRKHAEALRVYRALAARREAKGYWDERIALLETMLEDGEAGEVTAAVDEIVEKEPKVPADVKSRLDTVRRKSVEQAQAERDRRAGEIRDLIRDLASVDVKTQTAARTALRERGDETWSFLVAALDRVDETVRRASAELLRELTKQNFGYRPEASLAENADAIRKWRTWVTANRPKPAAPGGP